MADPIFTPELIARYASQVTPTNQGVSPSLPPEGPNWMHRLGIPALAAGQGLDAATTLAVLGQGGREENAVYGAHPSDARVLATKAAIGIPLGFVLDKIYDHAAPGSATRKAALIAALLAGGSGGLAAAHNFGQMK